MHSVTCRKYLALASEWELLPVHVVLIDLVLGALVPAAEQEFCLPRLSDFSFV